LLAEGENANAEATIPMVELHLRLGWEPNMDYMTARAPPMEDFRTSPRY
jgi:hypothetical protein